MSEQTFRIIYCSSSSAEHRFDRSEFDQLLDKSRRNNAAVNVTGALLHNNGLFAQALEGPFDAVQSVFERIQADPRHDGVVVLQAETVEGRLFADWSMAHAEPDNPARARETLSRALIDKDGIAASALLNLLSHVVRHVPA